MTNEKTHQIFSRDFALNVLDLKSIHLATNEDKACRLDYWARLFAAKTWEELKMLAKNNEAIQEAVVTLCELSAEDEIRMQCEARERYEGDMESCFDNGVKKGLQKGLQLSIINQARKKYAMHVSAANCAEMLETNEKLIEGIYQQLTVNPSMNNEEIHYELRRNQII